MLKSIMAMLLALNVLDRLNQRARRRERVFRDRSNPLDQWNDIDMFKKYRFSRLACINIIEMLEEQLEHPTKRNHALPASLQVFIGLRFFGHGSILDDSGAEPHGVSVPTACRAVKRVAKALCRIQSRVIKWPSTNEEVREKQRRFQAVDGFPRIVGAVDCTHIRLFDVILGENEFAYVNRKGKEYINI